MRIRFPALLRAGLLICCLLAGAIGGLPPARAAEIGCKAPGWSPQDFKLKDHSVFQFQGLYYLVSIRFTTPGAEEQFAYARSADLCSWEDLGLILGPAQRQRGTWDSQGIWSPFVLEEQGVYYLFYTGVATGITQSIMLATSTNPADPQSWQPRGVIFQPDHAGMVWPGLGFWSDARDPMVLKANGRYYLYYTGRDQAGAIVGVATAGDLHGPWQDLGATLTPGATPESSGVIGYGGRYYLFYTRTDAAGPEVRMGPSPLGPWSEPSPLRPGFAHEFWTTTEGDWMTSYVTDYSVAIRPVSWTFSSRLPMPAIAVEPVRTFLPFVGAGS